MRVFVAGASGAIGSRLVPQLVAAGHEVVGSHNSPATAERVRTLGAEPVALDLLDPKAVRQAVLEAEPDAIVHQATALANARFGRNLDRTFAQTNRLRTAGTDNLLAAAREAGVGRFVAQSFASLRYAREGGMVKSEQDPLDPTPPKGAGETHAAMRHLDQAVTDAGGIALRYGGFYGAANDGLVEPVRKRRLPIVGDGAAVWSFIHLDDAAAATVLALDHDGPAIYNIVDDEPAPVREWLPVLASALGAPQPRHIPGWLGRLVGRRRGHRLPRRLQRQSQARTQLDSPLLQLAARLPRHLRHPGDTDPRPGRPRVSLMVGQTRNGSCSNASTSSRACTYKTTSDSIASAAPNHTGRRTQRTINGQTCANTSDQPDRLTVAVAHPLHDA